MRLRRSHYQSVSARHGSLVNWTSPRSGFHSHTERDGPHANFKVQCMYGPVAKTICLGAILLCQCSEWLWQEIALRITKQAKHIFRLLPAHLDLEVQLRGQDSSVLTESSNSPWGRVRASKATGNDSSAAERLLSSHLEGNCHLLCAHRISCTQPLHVGRLPNESDCFISALYVSISTHPFFDVLLVLHACCWKTWFQSTKSMFREVIWLLVRISTTLGCRRKLPSVDSVDDAEEISPVARI